ncbi:NADH dehydrogenase (ubiquinone) 1 beta subcomplex subunit 10 [Paragonimus westermani]|uniref:NADH dehydrogenase [ubiquinone] 1 beta subcomplex subunit 10 n=1 Tax=Paragonimus westermani TaxID=34504 RepID=A0A5J4N6T7_9TREM|nr:NADH dehydrogenase (ubiquinone) 1 beta subcomplex subunit 10 [Paragonimus westermani]
MALKRLLAYFMDPSSFRPVLDNRSFVLLFWDRFTLSCGPLTFSMAELRVMVDTNILRILRNRRRECSTWHRHQKEDVERFCKDIIAEHEEAVVNFFIKYGELSWNTDVRHAFWKQKHRMLWERRYGPVGNGDSPAFAVDRAMTVAEETLKKEDNMFTKLRASVGQIGFPKEMRP